MPPPLPATQAFQKDSFGAAGQTFIHSFIHIINIYGALDYAQARAGYLENPFTPGLLSLNPTW